MPRLLTTLLVALCGGGCFGSHGTGGDGQSRGSGGSDATCTVDERPRPCDCPGGLASSTACIHGVRSCDCSGGGATGTGGVVMGAGGGTGMDSGSMCPPPDMPCPCVLNCRNGSPICDCGGVDLMGTGGDNGMGTGGNPGVGGCPGGLICAPSQPMGVDVCVVDDGTGEQLPSCPAGACPGGACPAGACPSGATTLVVMEQCFCFTPCDM